MFTKVKNWIKSRWGIVPTWKQSWKWISNQLTVLGTLLIGFAGEIYELAQHVISTIGIMPRGMLMHFDSGTVQTIGLVFIVSSIFARVTVQKKLPQE